MVKIKWKIHGDVAIFESEDFFERKRAEYLVTIANINFRRAHHWVSV